MSGLLVRVKSKSGADNVEAVVVAVELDEIEEVLLVVVDAETAELEDAAAVLEDLKVLDDVGDVVVLLNGVATPMPG